MSAQYVEFEKYFGKILNDFKDKKKTQEVILYTVRAELIPFFEKTVTNDHELFMGNRYFQSDMDEVRDMIISKKPLTRDTEEHYEEEEVKEERYIYVDIPRPPQKPKDITNIIFLNKNLTNQSWNYRLCMPICGKLNQFQGVYIRAPDG